MDTEKLGTIYLDKGEICPGLAYNGKSAITLGNTIPGKAISWVRSGDMLVARNCIATNISWNQLNRLGFVFGHPVKIDGIPYRCRCLEDSSNEGDHAEWDDLLATVGFHDVVWKWKDLFFWCQNSVNNKATQRAVRGCLGANYWSYRLASKAYPNVGWRPVLEELPPEPVLSKDLIGSTLGVYGEDGFAIEGVLKAVDDYDLSMSFFGRFPYRSWAARKGSTVYIERSHITWMEVPKN